MNENPIVILETDRLKLRCLTSLDAEFAFQLNEDPLVNQYTDDGPFDSVEETRSFLDNYPDYKKYGIGRWGVELKSNGNLIGWAGLKYLEKEEVIDLGYRFFQSEWGNGYATEAASACLNYGFQTKKFERIIAHVMTKNKASIRVLEKIGMRQSGIGNECGAETYTFEMLNPNRKM